MIDKLGGIGYLNVGTDGDQETMKWFSKGKSGLDTANRKDLPPNLWTKCPGCKEIIYNKELAQNFAVCDHCGFHFQINAPEYIKILIDEGTWQETDADLKSNDPLKFVDLKKYKDRLNDYYKKTGLTSAVISGYGKINKREVSLGIMDFRFGGGSMGTVEGEKLTRVFRRALEKKTPAVVITKSGGARMQEGTLSLMQMAKTSAYISLLSQAGLPYICVLTHPTTGGVTASFAMLGDVHIAEPEALIGFAGLRVIKETIRQDLPDNFQKAELLVEKGFIDMIVPRAELKARISILLDHLTSSRK